MNEVGNQVSRVTCVSTISTWSERRRGRSKCSMNEVGNQVSRVTCVLTRGLCKN